MKDEEFICDSCHKKVNKLNYTARDHCPYCLYSKHVDINPGDRKNNCLGLLKPITIEKYKNTYNNTSKESLLFILKAIFRAVYIHSRIKESTEEGIETSSIPLALTNTSPPPPLSVSLSKWYIYYSWWTYSDKKQSPKVHILRYGSEEENLKTFTQLEITSCSFCFCNSAAAVLLSHFSCVWLCATP